MGVYYYLEKDNLSLYQNASYLQFSCVIRTYVYVFHGPFWVHCSSVFKPELNALVSTGDVCAQYACSYNVRTWFLSFTCTIVYTVIV